MAYIEESFYRQVLRAIPILCVDLVIRHEGHYLLVKRARAPLRGRWWVPGGRILKGESVVEAAHRKAKEEVGLALAGEHVCGYFEGRFHSSHQGPAVHTVSIVVEATPKLDSGSLTEAVRLEAQSTAWKLSPTLPRDFVIRPFGKG